MTVFQLFSILANEFKADTIVTIEFLVKKILEAPITPKPIYRSLSHIYDWKEFVTPYLSEEPLQNHSLYHSFAINKETEGVKFRGKFLPQMPDSSLYPKTGIRLLKKITDFEPIGAAGFRLANINFDNIIKGLKKYTDKLPLLERMNVISSWENLRHTLESSVRNSSCLKKLKLLDFPTQNPSEDVEVPDYLQNTLPPDCLSGEYYLEEPDEGDLDEISEGSDVCVYTLSKRGRPWVGRVVQILPSSKFMIKWFVKSNSSARGGCIFRAMPTSDDQNISEIDRESIMFWHMTEQREEDSFFLSKYWLEVMKKEYESLDC